MALKPCRECKKKVSTEALTCPNCGAPHPTTKAIKKVEPEFQYKFGDVKIENKEVSIIKINQKDTYVRCEKSFCSKKFKVIKIVKSKLGKELCESCGNPLVKVTNTQAKKYFDDNSNIQQKDTKTLKVKNDLNGEYFFNGTKSLAETFWLYFFVGNKVFVLFEYLLLKNESETPIFYFIVILHIIWTALSIMGVFNSANMYKAKKIKQGQTYGYATAAKIATVLLVLSSIGNAL